MTDVLFLASRKGSSRRMECRSKGIWLNMPYTLRFRPNRLQNRQHQKQTPCRYLIYKGFLLQVVVPKGLEPLSREPESLILSIELRDQKIVCKDIKNELSGKWGLKEACTSALTGLCFYKGRHGRLSWFCLQASCINAFVLLSIKFNAPCNH
jgi:hypothetical protein